MAVYKKQYNAEVKCTDSGTRLLEYKSWFYHCELLNKQLIISCLSFLISKTGRTTFLYLFSLLERLNEYF